MRHTELQTALLAMCLSGCSVPPAGGFASEPHLVQRSGVSRAPIESSSATLEPVFSAPTSLAEARADDPLERPVTAEALATPVTALLMAVARQAGLGLQVQGADEDDAKITLSMIEQPLSHVLDEITRQADLSWVLQGRALRIYGDEPWFERYPIPYPNLDREFSSRIGLATEVGSIRGAADGQDSGIANSSSASIENRAHFAFWDGLERDLSILAGQKPGRVQYTINRDAGLLGLHAPAIVHRRVSEWLDALLDNSSRQVLIEASVVEVVLSREHEAGIDWQYLAQGLVNGASGLAAGQWLHGQPAVTDNASRPVPEGLLTLVQRDARGELQATLRLLETFGDVHIVSRPRILAMNNQPAVLKVVDNRVYFTVSVERQLRDQREDIVTDTEIHTVPVGLVMNVIPHIRADGSVMLNVRPSLSRIVGFVDDPSPELARVGARNGVPEIQVREMESLLRLGDGELAIIGGLMQAERSEGSRGIPGLSALPGVGSLFKRVQHSGRRSELLILLRSTVLES